jgi:uncharacterized protein
MRSFASVTMAAILCSAAPRTFADSPLADAVEKIDRRRIKTLLQSKAEINASQADGMTALHWAVYQDDLETAQSLVHAGANVSATNRYGITPLYLACLNGNGALTSLLLDEGADANTAVRGGETVLMIASRTGRAEVVKVLLDHGANVNAKDRRGQTALMWAAADGHADVVTLLVKAGADFVTPLESGFTPLLFAVREGRSDVVRTLLKAGADVNAEMKPKRSGGRYVRPGTTPLILAIENGHFELALQLVDAGADPNDMRTGFTPLHTISWVRKPNRGDGEEDLPPPGGSGKIGSLEFVEKLVSRGADVNTRLKTKRTGKAQLNTAGMTPFLAAADTADLPLMKLLVKLGADPRINNDDNCTPLMAAGGIGTLAPGEEAGDEPECIAAVQYCLELGLEINAVDNNGETAMHGAAYKGYPKLVQFLVDHGANIDIWNSKNKHGWTPLLIAQGYRPGNFRPLAETIAAIEKVMLAAGVTPPSVTKAVVEAPEYKSEGSKTP